MVCWAAMLAVKFTGSYGLGNVNLSDGRLMRRDNENSEESYRPYTMLCTADRHAGFTEFAAAMVTDAPCATFVERPAVTAPVPFTSHRKISVRAVALVSDVTRERGSSRLARLAEVMLLGGFMVS
jgi:hypothetical protein